MTALLISVAIAALAGAPLLRNWSADERWQTRTGAAILAGLALAVAVMFVESALHVRWTLGWILVPLLLAAGAGFAIRSSGELATPPRAAGWDAVATAADAVTLLVVTGHGIFATLAAPFEHDFLAIWGLKAQQFWYAGGIDWKFLEGSVDVFSHPDYPLFVPIVDCYVSLFAGRWDDRWIGFLTTVFGFALLLVVRGLLEEELSPRASAVCTLGLAPLALSPWIGLADGPMVAYGAAGLLLVRKGLREASNRSLIIGALMLGISANVKNEGLTLVIAAIVASLAALKGNRRFLWRLWPAAGLALVWIVVRSAHSVSNDIVTSGFASRLLSQFGDIARLVRVLAEHPAGMTAFWIGVGVAIAIGARRILPADGFVLAAVALQIAVFIAVYAATPNDLAWQVRWSWDRLLSQVELPLGVVAAVLCYRILGATRSES